MNKKTEAELENIKNSIQSRSVNFTDTDLKEDGTFSGYASVFGAIDSYGTSWAKGCFKDCLDEMQRSGRVLPMVWSHDYTDPIGKYTKLEEDNKGLYVEGKLLLSVSRAREVYDLMKEKIITGLSVSIDVQEYDYDVDSDLITFTRCSLYEISPCLFPAVKEARIDTVRSELTPRYLERVLHEAGLSRAMSAKYANEIVRELSDKTKTDTIQQDLAAFKEFFNDLRSDVLKQ